MKFGASTLPSSCWPLTVVRRRTTAPPSGCCSPTCCRLRRGRHHRAARPTWPTRRRRAASDHRSRPDNRRLRRGRRTRAPAEIAPAVGGTGRRSCSHLADPSRRGCGGANGRQRRRRTRTQTRDRRTSLLVEVTAPGRTAAAGYDISAI